MKPTDYFRESARTLTPLDETQTFEMNWHRIASMAVCVSPDKSEYTMEMRQAPESVTLLHGLLGLIGEMGELEEALNIVNRDEVRKEFGDIWWYAAAMCRGARWSFDEMVSDVIILANDAEQLKNRISLRVNRISEPYKKWVFYGKPLNLDELLVEVVLALVNATRAAMLMGVTIAEAQEFNIEKLRKRYPDKFDEAAAVAKADEG